MKLLSVDLERFARFDKIALALNPGLNVIVGKNNTGKTAILRGLSALAGLPIAPVGQFSQLLGDYIPSASTLRNFSLRVKFHIEAGDPQLIAAPEPNWQRFLETEKPILEFVFLVWPDQNQVNLEEAWLAFGDKRFKIVQVTKGSPNLSIPDSEGNVPNARGLDVDSHRTAPDGKPAPILRRDNLFGALARLQSIVLIEAHRKTAPEETLATAVTLSGNAYNLAAFLQTLVGRERAKFEEVERFVTHVFPEYEYLNAESNQNRVFISLTIRGTTTKVRLTHCGTGVEQILVLATFVLSSPPGSIILIDEPHSYLHPTAERELIEFLASHGEHRYIISTHSPVIVNYVDPDRIIYLSSEQSTVKTTSTTAAKGTVLHSLGFRNSDFLFNDRLLFVEGESDREILPILMEKTGGFEPATIARTGFPTMDGGGRVRGRKRQTSVLYYEAFLKELGRVDLPRIYLFDGHYIQEDQTLLQGTKMYQGGRITFLRRWELENYLLVPGAIRSALIDIAKLGETKLPAIGEDDISTKLQELLNSEDPKLYPNGKQEKNRLCCVKGSSVLEGIFSHYGLVYNKRESGKLIARYVPTKEPSLGEIVDLIKDIFS